MITLRRRRELYRTNTPPAKGETIEYEGRSYKVTKVKCYQTTPWQTCVVYGRPVA